MREFMSDIGGYTDAEIEAMQGTPAWQARLAASPTVPRELRAEAASRSTPSGSATSPPDAGAGRLAKPRLGQRSTQAFAAAIPGAELRTLEGHGHGAAVSAPELLAAGAGRLLRLGRRTRFRRAGAAAGQLARGSAPAASTRCSVWRGA